MTFRCEAVVFDMDGLLLDTERVYRAAFEHTSRALGFEPPENLYISLIGLNRDDAAARILAEFGRDFPMRQFKVDWVSYWTDEITQNGVPVKPGVSDLLSLLDTHKKPRAVATSSPAEHAHALLEQSGLVTRFDTIVTGDQIPRGKPEPDIFLEAAKRLNVDPSHCVALEDSDNGLLAASAAGMTALMVPDFKQPSQRAQHAAHKVLSSLHEAHVLIETVLAPSP